MLAVGHQINRTGNSHRTSADGRAFHKMAGQPLGRINGCIDLDLYGQPISVSFVQRIRGQLTFDDVSGLVTRMGQDVAMTRDLLARHA